MLIAVLGPLGALNALAASSLSDIKVSNAQREATVSVSFNGPPDYAFFPLHGPDRVVLDVNQKGKVGGLPLNFSGQNLVKSIRSSAPKDAQSVRLVFDLTQRAKTRVSTRQNGSVHTVVFTITAEGSANTVVRKAPVQTPAPVAVNPPPRQAPVAVREAPEPPLRKAPTDRIPLPINRASSQAPPPKSRRATAAFPPVPAIGWWWRSTPATAARIRRHWPERAERKECHHRHCAPPAGDAGRRSTVQTGADA